MTTPPEPAEGDLAGAIRRTAHLVPPSADEVVEVVGPVDVDLDEVLDAADPHAVAVTRHPWGAAWSCACGRWEGAATGPGSAAYIAGDHARHRQASGG